MVEDKISRLRGLNFCFKLKQGDSIIACVVLVVCWWFSHLGQSDGSLVGLSKKNAQL